jgi:hypothetical protein
MRECLGGKFERSRVLKDPLNNDSAGKHLKSRTRPPEF